MTPAELVEARKSLGLSQHRTLATMLEREADGCRCCRDLPPYLTCNPAGTATCRVCGWSERYRDLDDAPEACPGCSEED